MSGIFDVENNKFIIEIGLEEKVLTHKELAELLENKMDEVKVIYDLLAKHPQLIKDY